MNVRIVQAMLWFVCAVDAERVTGLTVLEQLSNAGQPGLIYFLAAVEVFTYASIMSGESTEALSSVLSQPRQRYEMGALPCWVSSASLSPGFLPTVLFSATK